MNPVDIGFGAILAIATLVGLLRGFVRIAFGLAGLGVSLGLALRWADRGPHWFRGVLASDELARVAAFVLTLAAGLAVTAVVAFLARKLVKAAELGWLDRLIGAGVGLAGGALLCAGLLVALTAFLPAGSPALRSSRIVPVTIAVSDMAAKILPPNMARIYRRHRKALRPWLAGSRPASIARAPSAP